MSINGIGSAGLSLVSQQMQNFKTGKANIQKEELEKLQSQMGGVQKQTSNMFSSLLESFEEVDVNGDGLSFEELKEFGKTQGNEGNSRPKHPRSSGGDGSELFEKLEAGDSISLSELEGVQQEMKAGGQKPPRAIEDMISSFDALDTNQDGEVSMSEIMANMQQERETFEAQASSNKVNVIDIFNKFLDNSKIENKMNNLFKSQIEQYSGISPKSI